MRLPDGESGQCVPARPINHLGGSRDEDVAWSKKTAVGGGLFGDEGEMSEENGEQATKEDCGKRGSNRRYGGGEEI